MADVDYMLGRPKIARLGTGLRRPKNSGLGLDVAGQVEAVGKTVRRFRPGDEVVGDLIEYGYGAFAEYVCAHEKAFALKPAGMTFEEAATVPQAAVMALQGLRGKRPIQPEHKVLHRRQLAEPILALPAAMGRRARTALRESLGFADSSRERPGVGSVRLVDESGKAGAFPAPRRRCGHGPIGQLIGQRRVVGAGSCELLPGLVAQPFRRESGGPETVHASAESGFIDPRFRRAGVNSTHRIGDVAQATHALAQHEPGVDVITRGSECHVEGGGVHHRQERN